MNYTVVKFLVLFLLVPISAALAQQKVVVVPLGGDEPNTVFKETETGDTPGTASQAYRYFEETIHGRIDSPGDVDYYAVILPFCQRLTATTQARGGDSCGNGGGLDSKVTIFNANQSLTLGMNDDISGSNRCSSAQGVSTSPGSINVYYVRVEASPDNCSQCTFNYQLNLSTEQWLC